MRISTHVLDIAQGRPAKDVAVRLEQRDANDNWRLVASGHTDLDGRCPHLLSRNEALAPGVYCLRFDTETYFAARKLETLYPFVEITFRVRSAEENFHLPLLLSPHGYTTYRGS